MVSFGAMDDGVVLEKNFQILEICSSNGLKIGSPSMECLKSTLVNQAAYEHDVERQGDVNLSFADDFDELVDHIDKSVWKDWRSFERDDEKVRRVSM